MRLRACTVVARRALGVAAVATLLSLPAPGPLAADVSDGSGASGPACHLASPPYRTALVEVFTLEGCSVCRIAHAWLVDATDAAPGRVVGLVWPRAASSPPLARHRWLTGRMGRADDTMPAVYLAGRTWDGWRDAGKEARSLGTINRWPAGAAIAIDVRSQASGQGAVLQVRVADAARLPGGRLQLHVALVGPGDGDAVVRAAWPPVPLGPDGSGRFDHGSVDAPDAGAVVAFVQDAETAEVVQALRAPLACRARRSAAP